MTTNWKNAERLICRALGGERRGPTGKRVSDCTDDVPWAVSIKHSRRGTPLGRWLIEAKQLGRMEKKPWLLCVKRFRSHGFTVTMEGLDFVRMAHSAGLLGPDVDERYRRLVLAIDPDSPIDHEQHVDDVMRTLDEIAEARGKRPR